MRVTVRRSQLAASFRLAAAFAGAAMAALALSSASSGFAQGGTSARAPASESSADAGTVTIRLALDRSGRGAFAARGEISDAGAATSRRAVRSGRVLLTGTLDGSAGTIVVRVTQTCGRSASTWRVVRGSGAYTGLTGAGTGTGRLGCGSPTAFRGVLRGDVQTAPLPQLARPGGYGGWTGQNERITFDVLADGRSLTNVRVERLAASCVPPLERILQPAFLGTYAIGPEGSFSIASAGSTLAGRFTEASAAGTITYAASDVPPFSCTSGAVAWTASTPPPPLPTALPGSYCGGTDQRRGVCLVLAGDGRLSYLRFEVHIVCAVPDTAEFEVEIGFGGRVSLRSNLSFELLDSLGGDAGGEYVLRGTFDSAGHVAGTFSLQRVTFDYEGTTYFCRSESFGWSAGRLR